ncbi:MAG: 3-dehydroquinate synthase [Ignavibacteriaceae bacterium]
MKKINVELKDNPYSVFLGKSILPQLQTTISRFNLYKKILVIIDENVERLHSDRVRTALDSNYNKILFYVLKPGEKSKSYTELNKIYSYMLENNYGRDSLIIVIGGGVTGDLGAFAASTFMRGVQLIHIPTTLLAAVDSSIGGKTGINFNSKKNMVGTFYQPKFVFIDIDFLQTLPKGEITSGAGEIIKYAYMADNSFYNYTNENLLKLFDFNLNVLQELIFNSALIKAGVVSQDEKESGIRKILNLGHTFAHAFESDLNFKIKHGEAVTAGVITALILSNKRGLLTDKKFEEFISLPMKMKLNKKITSFNIENVFSLMHSDKKNREGKIKFVLVSDIGKLLVDLEADKKDVYYALNKTREILT